MDSSQRSRERLDVYFASCNSGNVREIAAHFTPDAVVWDANSRPARGRDEIGPMWVRRGLFFGGMR